MTSHVEVQIVGEGKNGWLGGGGTNIHNQLPVKTCQLEGDLDHESPRVALVTVWTHVAHDNTVVGNVGVPEHLSSNEDIS